MPDVRGVEKVGVEKLGPAGHVADHRLPLQRQLGFGFEDLRRQIGTSVPVPYPVAGGVEEHPRERIVDQRIVAFGFGRARRRHAQRRRPHTLGDFPGVVVSSRHNSNVGEVARCQLCVTSAAGDIACDLVFEPHVMVGR